MPKPFLNKLIVHGAIGFFCVLFGCIYGFITDDQIFLLMSLCIGVGTAIRIVSLLHTIKMHDYTELTGTCTKREVSPLTKKQKIIFRSTDQKEYHFTFDKNIRLLSGHYYRLYFRNVARTAVSLPEPGFRMKNKNFPWDFWLMKVVLWAGEIVLPMPGKLQSCCMISV